MPTSPRGLAYERIDLTPPWRAPRVPVVFHHGLGTNRDIWAGWLARRAPLYPVTRFDMRGFGASGPLPAQIDGLLDILIDDLFEVAGDAPRVHLVGESAGGTVVLAAALQRPERVASVTVSNAAYVGRRVGQIGGWRDQFAQGGVRGWSDRMMECRFAPGALDADAAAWFAAEQERTIPAAALAIADMLLATDLSASLPGLAPPLLVMAPTASPFVPLEVCTQLHELVPGSELEVFHGVRHGLPFSHADACAQRLLAFLARHPA
jgi:pimeloyl-ACP methyl ester carboxylesterase